MPGKRLANKVACGITCHSEEMTQNDETDDVVEATGDRSDGDDVGNNAAENDADDFSESTVNVPSSRI